MIIVKNLKAWGSRTLKSRLLAPIRGRLGVNRRDSALCQSTGLIDKSSYLHLGQHSSSWRGNLS
jgi:hypothetical protein